MHGLDSLPQSLMYLVIHLLYNKVYKEKISIHVQWAH